eukprot:scaffold17907_cov21-Tisochrysis_lutea.AAC.1
MHFNLTAPSLQLHCALTACWNFYSQQLHCAFTALQVHCTLTPCWIDKHLPCHVLHVEKVIFACAAVPHARAHTQVAKLQVGKAPDARSFPARSLCNQILLLPGSLQSDPSASWSLCMPEPSASWSLCNQIPLLTGPSAYQNLLLTGPSACQKLLHPCPFTSVGVGSTAREELCSSSCCLHTHTHTHIHTQVQLFSMPPPTHTQLQLFLMPIHTQVQLSLMPFSTHTGAALPHACTHTCTRSCSCSPCTYTHIGAATSYACTHTHSCSICLHTQTHIRTHTQLRVFLMPIHACRCSFFSCPYTRSCSSPSCPYTHADRQARGDAPVHWQPLQARPPLQHWRGTAQVSLWTGPKGTHAVPRTHGALSARRAAGRKQRQQVQPAAAPVPHIRCLGTSGATDHAREPAHSVPAAAPAAAVQLLRAGRFALGGGDSGVQCKAQLAAVAHWQPGTHHLKTQAQVNWKSG